MDTPFKSKFNFIHLNGSLICFSMLLTSTVYAKSANTDERIKQMNEIVSQKYSEDRGSPNEIAARNQISTNSVRSKNIQNDNKAEDAGDQDEVRPDGSKGGNLKEAAKEFQATLTKAASKIKAGPSRSVGTNKPSGQKAGSNPVPQNNTGPVKTAKPGYAEPAIVFPSGK